MRTRAAVMGTRPPADTIAPMLAEEGVRGIATYAAFARPWPAHIADQTMRQWKLGLLKDDEIKANLEKRAPKFEDR